MLAWVRNLVRRRAQRIAGWFSLLSGEAADQGPLVMRRWEAAKSDRLNQAHWKGALGQSINADLMADLPTLWTRCSLETANNPILEGMIRSHAVDIVGKHGPTLQVISDNPRYSQALEKVWRAWFKRPEATGRKTGPAVLRGMVRCYWTRGESLTRFVSDPDGPGPFQTRLSLLEPTWMATPPGEFGNPLTLLGVSRNRYGRPIRYWCLKPEAVLGTVLSFMQYESVPPDMILHFYEVLEEGQARGVPWMAPSLPAIADLRDYDTQVLDAARAAADTGIFFWSNHPDVQFQAFNESVEIERRTQSFIPPGYQVTQIQPGQPAAQYVDYRRERFRDWGRPVHMPLHRIRLDSSEHNYSSARMDELIYEGGIEMIRSDLLEPQLDRIVEEVAREAELLAAAGMLDPILADPRPDVQTAWIWQPLPKADPEKEAKARQINLAMGLDTWSELLAQDGKDPEAHVARLQADNVLLVGADLPPVEIHPGRLGPAKAAPAEDQPSAENQPTPQQGKANGQAKAKAAAPA